jgi:hypothetical protein
MIALLAGMSGAHAQGAPGAGSFPGSFLVPGTQTSFRVAGYVKLDYAYDFGPTQNIRGGVDFSSIPFDSGFSTVLGGKLLADAKHHIHGDSQFTASQSRFNIETRTPTAYGEMKTFIEGDFTNPNGLTNNAFFKVFSNSSGFRLRHAYGTLGPLLAGQTWTLFMDLDASVETLDFGGPPTVFVRAPQVRYTFDFGNGVTLQASAENPQSLFTSATSVARGGDFSSTFGLKQGDKIPDFIVRANYNAPWGHVSLAGVFRDIYNHDGGATVHTSEFGWGAMLGASFNMPWGKDQLTLEGKGGDGIGRYNNSDDPFADAVAKNATNALKTITSYGGVIGYTHYWSDTLRSNATAGYVRAEYPSGIFTAKALADQLDRLYTGHVNLIWSPVPQTDFGIEYIYGKQRLVDGQSGALNRAQLSAKFRF